jgi:hypothetical protein
MFPELNLPAFPTLREKHDGTVPIFVSAKMGLSHLPQDYARPGGPKRPNAIFVDQNIPHSARRKMLIGIDLTFIVSWIAKRITCTPEGVSGQIRFLVTN